MVTRRRLEDRILGSVVGASIGDAMGGAFEGASAEYVRKRIGTDWIDDMYGYAGRLFGAYGVWWPRSPAGTGTDDTRMNHVFIESVIDHRGFIGPQLLAAEYIRRYRHAEGYYPKRVAEMARRHFQDFFPVSCGCLGMECPELPGVPVEVLRDRSFGYRAPSLIGLLSLACAGTLYANDPVRAYRKAYELSYFDVGYAKEACGLHAAAVSMAVGGIQDVEAILRRLSRLDPFRLARGRFGQSLHPVVRRAGQLARKAGDARDLVLRLSRELATRHIFDPIDTLTVSLAANRFAPDNPRQAILVGVNHRDVDAGGDLVRFRDNDCTGYVTGSLAGALSGARRLPADWVDQVLAANKKVYGIDIEANVSRLVAVAHAG
ncbi:MAG TPA: ADP-ribosylglycohydrolase family protein [Phycisphaerae bacterium]|nr:ADP-ribosylglycohydrolase family protein [Phycisphaerae bacterium]